MTVSAILLHAHVLLEEREQDASDIVAVLDWWDETKKKPTFIDLDCGCKWNGEERRWTSCDLHAAAERITRRKHGL
jgi:hypothetical protein